MPSGGNHPPARPAQVSGPGALSQRTDGQPIRVAPGGAYGDRQELQQLQSAAPLAAAGTPNAAPAAGIDPSQLTGLGEPTTSPETPVTAGAAAGAGPGPEAIGVPPDPKRAEAQALGKYLPVMIRIADSEDATPAFRSYVRELLANL